METVNLLDSFLQSGASNGSRLAGPKVCGNGVHWKKGKSIPSLRSTEEPSTVHCVMYFLHIKGNLGNGG